MKKLLFLPLLFVVFCTAAQRNVDLKVTVTSAQSLPAYNKYATDGDEGERTVEVRIDIDKKGRCKPFVALCRVNAGTAQSAPRLEEGEIYFTKFDCKNGSKTAKLKLNLKAVSCLTADETVNLVFSVKDIKGAVATIPLTIQKLSDIPDQQQVRLLPVVAELTPRKKGEATDNGLRTVMVDLLVSGKSPRDQTLTFTSPMEQVLKSKPSITYQPTISKDRVPADGCPVKLTVPVGIKLEETASPKEAEVFVIGLGDDFRNAAKVTIKALKDPEPEVKKPDTNYLSRFTHACFNGLNLEVFLYMKGADGRVDVRKAGTTNLQTYYFSQQTPIADLAKWISNVFNLSASGNPCNDCVFCATYIAERIAKELELHQEKQAAAKPAAAAETAAKSDTAKKDSDANKQEAKADTAATASKKKDTVVYESTFFYDISQKLKLRIVHTSGENEVTLCHTMKAGGDTCETQSTVADMSTIVFQEMVTKMAGKLLGSEMDPEKFLPDLSKQYSDYQAKLKENDPPKEDLVKKGFNDAFSVILKEKDTSVVVGTLRLKDSSVYVYNNGVIIRKVNIKSVRFSLSDGRVPKRLLIVETDGGRFTNYRSPIPVGHIGDKNKVNNLFNIGGDGAIKLNDVLYYVPNHWYYPDDLENITLDKKNPDKELTANANLNSIMNIALFTDLAGLTGRRANGILNTEANVRLITNTSNIRNTDITIFPKIDLTVALSKFDSKFRSLDSSDVFKKNNAEKDTVNRMILLQKSWVRAEFGATLISARFKQMQTLSLNVGMRFNAINADSFFLKDYDILAFEYFIEPVYTINRFKNFGAEIAARFDWHVLADKEPFSNTRSQYLFSPRFSVYYYPLGTPSSRIYFRFNYYADKKRDALNFYQMQIGWKTDINFTGKK